MLSFFPRDVLDEILDLIESISGGGGGGGGGGGEVPTYSRGIQSSYYRHN